MLNVCCVLSCSIDNVQPRNILLEDNVITDETTAVNVLNRVYNSGTRNYFYGNSDGIVTNFTAAGIEANVLDASGSLTQFNTNNVLDDSQILQDVYSDMYYTINLTNFFIEIVERGDANVSDERKNELVAEAKFFRALCHFNLLRTFGQFYDLNSSYGIVLSTSPIKSDQEFARSSVQEAYNLITEDLQFASTNAAGSREHYYASATTAKALLSKVQLYMGDYENASQNALAVINNTDGYALDTDYANVFSDRWGTETIFAAYVEADTEGEQGAGFLRSTLGPSLFLTDLADAQDGVASNGNSDYTDGYDPRFMLQFDTTSSLPYGGKYPYAPNGLNEGNTVKILRMGEIYLIYAEAEARRIGGDLNASLDKLNDLRTRVSIAPRTLSGQAALLQDILKEKELELFFETGENWFDLVRYESLGDINVSDIKPTITSENKLIYPIPMEALLGNNLLIQNPGY